jgi:hypothetical protein
MNLSAQVALRGLLIITVVSGGCDHAGRRERKEMPFRIIATDAGFEAPDAVAVGLRHIVFENRGSRIHEAMLVKLPAGMDANAYGVAVKAGSLFPKGALDYSGPGLMSPNEMVEMWLRVDPGEYVLICWNHARSEPVHAFSARPPTLDDALPRPDVVLKLLDYRFEFKGKLHSGEQVIQVETPGPSMHEADLFRLHPGKTVADIRKWRTEHLPVAPVDALGGALDSHDIKRVVWLRKRFTPGRYVLHCAVPITTTSETTTKEITHADLGMVQEFEIEP